MDITKFIFLTINKYICVKNSKYMEILTNGTKSMTNEMPCMTKITTCTQ